MAVPKKEGEISGFLSEVRYSGVFDYDALYKLIHSWLADHYYSEIQESAYKHKMVPTGAEVELTISGQKKQSEFILFKIIADTHFWDLTEVEVTKDGKKQKLMSGRFWIRFKYTLVIDYQKQFEGKVFYVKLFNFLKNKILKMHIILLYLDTLEYELYRLQAAVKKALNMETAYNAY